MFKGERDKLIPICIGNSPISCVCIILIQSIYSQFQAVRSAVTAMKYVLSHCVLLFRLCVPQVLVACKHIKVVHTQYLIPFELDCQFFHSHPMLLTNTLLGSAVNAEGQIGHSWYDDVITAQVRKHHQK